MIKINLKAYFLLALFSYLNAPTVDAKLILMSGESETRKLDSGGLVNAGVLKAEEDDSLNLAMKTAQKLTDAEREAVFPGMNELDSIIIKSFNPEELVLELQHVKLPEREFWLFEGGKDCSQALVLVRSTREGADQITKCLQKLERLTSKKLPLDDLRHLFYGGVSIKNEAVRFSQLRIQLYTLVKSPPKIISDTLESALEEFLKDPKHLESEMCEVAGQFLVSYRDRHSLTLKEAKELSEIFPRSSWEIVMNYPENKGEIERAATEFLATHPLALESVIHKPLPLCDEKDD